jgi:hypothetical protein
MEVETSNMKGQLEFRVFGRCNRGSAAASCVLRPLFVGLAMWGFGAGGGEATGASAADLLLGHNTTEAASPGMGPRIRFADPVFDFGQVKSGGVVSHTFVFTNIGDQLIEIRDVRPSCGCTTAGGWDRSVLPGQIGKIPVQFDSGNFSGAIGKTVIVVCNDPLETNIVLQVKGKIWKPIEVTPTIAFFSTTSDCETNETRLVRIVSNLEEPLEVSPPECTNSSFQATVKTVQPGKEFELGVSFQGSEIPATITAPISLGTTSSNMPLIIVMACAIVQAPVVATPAQLTLPAGELVTGAQLSVEIRCNANNPLILSDVSVDPAGPVVRLQEVQKGRQFILTATLPEGFRILPGQSAEIRVKTNQPRFPLLKIPVIEGHSLAASLRSPETSLPTAQPRQP